MCNFCTKNCYTSSFYTCVEIIWRDTAGTLLSRTALHERVGNFIDFECSTIHIMVIFTDSYLFSININWSYHCEKQSFMILVSVKRKICWKVSPLKIYFIYWQAHFVFIFSVQSWASKRGKCLYNNSRSTWNNYNDFNQL